MKSNFRKIAASLAIAAAVAAGTVGAVSSTSVEDAKANSVKVAARANSV